jgi:sarcosine/dimethylglycine N-methyltransferase
MNGAYSQTVKTAQEYYNSDDADNFYFHIWGGQDIHIGSYASPDEDIATASEHTVRNMAAQLHDIGADTRVIDIGAGYGGAARWLAQTHLCHVSCLNLSEAQNVRNRTLTDAAGLTKLIEVTDGSFEDIPYPGAQFDVAWSQDAMLHSGRRPRALEEIDRVLKPGGEFIFTDPMQSDDCPPGVLQPVLDRIHLETLGSPGFYRRQATRLGWQEVGFTDLTPQLLTHYSRVREELQARRGELRGKVSDAYIERMLQGLGYWVDAAHNGYLSWGILHFRKPA